MEVAAVAIQQATSQLNLGISMLKAQAQVQQATAEMVQQAAQSSRGGNLDITV